MIIYRAINKINGKSYIGLTTLTLGERKHKHWLNSRNPDKNKKQAFYLAISKYGWDSFEWQELCSALTKEALVSLEIDFIKEYDSYNKGYNNTLGGEGVNNPQKLEKYLIKFPDGIVRIVTGYKRFCREHSLNEGNLWHTYRPYKCTKKYKAKDGYRYYTYWLKEKHCKGYTLLGKFNDYLGTEYLQVEGSGGLLTELPVKDDDIV